MLFRSVGFTTMLGSGEAAQSMLNDLRDFAAKTPFQFEDLTKAASRMIAMGTAAEDVIPTLTAVGEAAAGLGLGSAGVDRITRALGQMGAKGKIGGDDLRQWSEAGVPALRYLAEAAGVTTAEMSKMIEKGIIPAEEGVKVLVQSMSADFGGLMAEQADTAIGALSNLEDATATLGTEVGQRMIPIVKSFSERLAELTLSVAEAMKASREEIGVVRELADAVDAGTISQDDFERVTSNSMQTVSDYTGEIDNSSAHISDMDAALLLLAEAQNQANFAQDRGADSVRVLGDQVNDLVPRIETANTVVKELATLMSLVGGATTEYEKDQKDNTKAITDTEAAIAKLTKNYRGQHAALLAGKGSVVDNTLAIEKANIAAERGEIAFGKLNERFANQSGIDAFNEGMANVDEAMRKLNEENAKGEMSADKFAEATKKLGERQNDVRERFDKSKMSTQEYNLSVRDHNVDLAEAATKMGELTAEHGKGFTAAELAAQATGAYNTKLAEMQTKLELAKQRDIELQTQVATRIKEGILLEEIALAAKDGFTKSEIALVDAAAKALGIADSAAVQGAITTGIAATTLADLRKTYQKDFDEGNAESVRLFGVGVDQVGSDIQNKLRPSFDRAQDSIKDTKKEMRELRDEYNGIQSKDVTIKITTIRETINRAAFAQIATNVASAKEIAAGERAMGGPVMGGAGAYLVGERGPELFNPSGTGGTITPNHALGRSGLAIGTLNVYGVQSTSELFNQLSREARARGLQFAVN